jgi:hypothetical protein
MELKGGSTVQGKFHESLTAQILVGRRNIQSTSGHSPSGTVFATVCLTFGGV